MLLMSTHNNKFSYRNKEIYISGYPTFLQVCEARLSLHICTDIQANHRAFLFADTTDSLLKAPYSSKIDILLSKKGLINWYMVLIWS